MDSLNAHDATTVLANLRRWLKHEWQQQKEKKAFAKLDNQRSWLRHERQQKRGAFRIARAGSSTWRVEDLDTSDIVADFFGRAGNRRSVSEFKLLKPAHPLQDNCEDCGVLVLQFVEETIRRWPNISEKDLLEQKLDEFSANMFTVGEMHVSRRYTTL